MDDFRGSFALSLICQVLVRRLAHHLAPAESNDCLFVSLQSRVVASADDPAVSLPYPKRNRRVYAGIRKMLRAYPTGAVRQFDPLDLQVFDMESSSMQQHPEPESTRFEVLRSCRAEPTCHACGRRISPRFDKSRNRGLPFPLPFGPIARETCAVRGLELFASSPPIGYALCARLYWLSRACGLSYGPTPERPTSAAQNGASAMDCEPARIGIRTCHRSPRPQPRQPLVLRCHQGQHR